MGGPRSQRQRSDLTAYRSALAPGTLSADDGPSRPGSRRFPGDALARAWIDVAGLTPQLREELDHASQDLDLGVDWLAAAVGAEDDGVRLAVGVRTPGGTGTEYEPKLVERVPADAVAALSFGGTQSTLDQVERTDPRRRISKLVQNGDGRLGRRTPRRVSPARASLYVAPGSLAPEVTLVLAPPDPDKAWDTVDRLVRKFAVQSGETSERPHRGR